MAARAFLPFGDSRPVAGANRGDYQQLLDEGGREVLSALYGLLMQLYELSFENKGLCVRDAVSYVRLTPDETRRCLENAEAARFVEIKRHLDNSDLDVILPGPKLSQFATGRATPTAPAFPLVRR